MAPVHDLRYHPIYRAAKEDGRKEGLTEGVEIGFKLAFKLGFEKGLEKVEQVDIEREGQRSFEHKSFAISKSAALQLPVADIAEILRLDMTLVQQTLTTK